MKLLNLFPWDSVQSTQLWRPKVSLERPRSTSAILSFREVYFSNSLCLEDFSRITASQLYPEPLHWSFAFLLLFFPPVLFLQTDLERNKWWGKSSGSVYSSIQAAIKNSIAWGLKTTDIYFTVLQAAKSKVNVTSWLIAVPGGSPLLACGWWSCCVLAWWLGRGDFSDLIL